MTHLIERVRAHFGGVSVIHWNAYARGAGDILKGSAAEVRRPFDVAVTGLVSVVQAGLAELESQGGAVLVTGGALAFFEPSIDAFANKWNLGSLAISKAAQHKLVGILAQSLEPRGVYVGEIVVKGTVKGSAFDTGGGNLDAQAIAERFWEMYTARGPVSVTMSP